MHFNFSKSPYIKIRLKILHLQLLIESVSLEKLR